MSVCDEVVAGKVSSSSLLRSSLAVGGCLEVEVNW